MSANGSLLPKWFALQLLAYNSSFPYAAGGLQSSSSTSNSSVASGGIFGGEPAEPYAYGARMMRSERSPLSIVAKLLSQPPMTCEKEL